MARQLKRLELQGFKSFAARTTFVFDEGITAIIGPNGSGKSNIADAMRWVLGEQSYGSLRSRRTEDVVFAGSASRSPVGMAEVSLTLDNEQGSLPLPFSEVTITRRAYRTGENQYFINRQQVRLKDIVQLTAALGQSHTVIGQGLVDAALSQRPDERRGLFEHAAGITGLRLKHAEAQRHLSEARTNIVRLEDLVREIEPHLHSLERAARRAREFSQLKGELVVALRGYYSWQWSETLKRLAQAEQAVASADAALGKAEADGDAHRRQVQSAEEQAAVLRDKHASLTRDIELLRDERQHLDHQLAVLAERRMALDLREAEGSRELATLRESLAETERERRGLAKSKARLDAECARQEQEVRKLEAAQREVRDRRAKLEAELRATDQRLVESRNVKRSAEEWLELLDQQRSDLLAAKQRLEAEAEDRARHRMALLAEQEAASENVQEATAYLADLIEKRNQVDTAIAENSAAQEAAREEAQQVQRRHVDCAARLEALKRLRDSGAGLRAGPRAVLEGVHSEGLTGIVGVLSSLISVPTELEAAIEAALGGHLQDIIVECWADAERAIDYLKRTRGGRATFRPLDTIRGGKHRHLPKHNVPGVRGIAADLVGGDARITPVLGGLLGQIVVVDTLEAARSLLSHLPPGWSIVTISGEIVRANGTVTGGAELKETGLLARERELRDLSKRSRAIQRDLQVARRRVEELIATGKGRGQQRAEVDHSINDVRDAERTGRAGLEQVNRALDELDRIESEDSTRLDEITRRLAGLEQERQQRAEDVRRMDENHRRANAERESLAARLESEDDATELSRLHQALGTLGTLRERRRGIEQQHERHDQQRVMLKRKMAAAETRAAALVTERQQLNDAVLEAERSRDRAAATLSSIERQQGETDVALRRAIAAEQSAREQTAMLDARTREAERERDRLILDRARRSDELDLLRERTARDLEIDEIDDRFALDPVEEPPDIESLEREIRRKREQLRRIGSVGEGVVEQYEQEAERYAFLQRQLDDVRQAGVALETLMRELERTMADKFDSTFGQVAEAFQRTFSALFGGGHARLVRNDETDISTSIDIIAQPPEKRLQNLALLSGGERALTAVALLFAILRVNPSPFCLLDEIDAALDEANVVRVRDELRALSRKTQVVIITHNRATIESADTLYGITMGRDGVSRVLSLQVPVEA